MPFWPLQHIPSLLAVRIQGQESGPRPVPVATKGPSWGPLTLSGVRAMHLGDLFYVGVGLIVYAYSWPSPEAAAGIPGLRNILTSWIGSVLLRNLFFEISFYEFWHQLLYGVLASEAVTRHRYSATSPYDPGPAGRPAQRSVWVERFWTINGFVWSTAWECFIIHIWASGAIPLCDDGSGVTSASGAGPLGLGCQMPDPSVSDFQARPMLLLWFMLGFPLTTQFRGLHFFLVHRCMHPWFGIGRSALDGDIGATLYRWVHSLHHKSYNPGPWSSLSMHPVEHLLYFSCFLLAFVVPYHPLHLLCNKFHTDLSALAGATRDPRSLASCVVEQVTMGTDLQAPMISVTITTQMSAFCAFCSPFESHCFTRNGIDPIVGRSLPAPQALLVQLRVFIPKLSRSCLRYL